MHDQIRNIFRDQIFGRHGFFLLAVRFGFFRGRLFRCRLFHGFRFRLRLRSIIFFRRFCFFRLRFRRQGFLIPDIRQFRIIFLYKDLLRLPV